MTFAQVLLSEFNQEAQTTRRVLERLPEGKFDWKPHAKSMSMGQLASHVAELTGWGAMILQQDSLDINPPGGPGFQPALYATTSSLLAAFEAGAASTRQVLETLADETLAQPWTLLNGGQTAFTLPKGAVLRAFVLNHVVHHRGQLSVYLRENDVPVPSIYGPSADEGGM